MLVTRKQLETAIANVLGESINSAMIAGRINLPTRHSAAIHRAFVYGSEADDSNILRKAQKIMDQNGHYKFADEADG